MPDPRTTGQPSTTRPPAHPLRVVTDIASFNLEKRPGPSVKHDQIGAVSRGSHTVLALCAPNSGLASNPRPLFLWQNSASAGTVKFSLYDSDQNVLFEADATGATLQYPEDAPPLVPGKTYLWTVSGNGGLDKLPPPAEVTLQDQATSSPILKEAAAAPDPLTRSQAFLRSQVWYDAVAELKHGLQQNPGRTDLTQQLQALYRQIAPACANPAP